MKRILLHVCCAPDGLYSASVLLKEYHVTGYFYNPCIQPADEYALRSAEYARVSSLLGIDSLEAPCDETRFAELAKGHEKDPERGARCALCYNMRLERTAREAMNRGFDLFATTLTLSPHKNAALINGTGIEEASKCGARYLPSDFKKNDGFKKSIEMSRAAGLYRQNYCGCLYSIRKTGVKNNV